MATIAKPDLTVSNLTVGITSIAPGGVTTVNFSISNSGGATAAASTAGVYLNNNGTLTLLKSVAVSALGANGGTFNSGGIAVTIPAGLAPNTYSIQVIADINGAVAESNEGNNTRAAAITVLPPPKPNLIVNSLTLNNASLAAGSTVAVNFSVINSGTASAAASTAGIYLNNNGTLTLLKSVAVSSLSVNGTFNSGGISVTVPGTLAPGSYAIYVTADTGGTVAESNEFDNTRTTALTIVPPPKPDLVVSGLGYTSSAIAGGNVTLNYTITNQGSVGAGNFLTRIYLSRDTVVDAGDTILATFGTKSLAAFASASGTVQVTLPGSYGAGNYNLIAVTDYDGEVGEIREDNNSRLTQITILAPPKPDLVVTNFSLGSSSVVPGASTTVNFSIANAGTGTAAASTAGIYLNDNGKLTLLKSVAVSSIAPNYGGSFTSGNIPVTIPGTLAGGSYNIVVSADINGTLAEIKEDNNSLSGRLRVVGNAASVFSFFGGQLSTLVDLSSAAYHGSVNPGLDSDNTYALLGNQLQWLSRNDLAISGMADGGIFTNKNGAALIGRTSDALFISFRGTDDATDKNQWFARQDQWALFDPLVSAVDQYVKANHITKVYVTGHSLGGGMAQEYMETHPDAGGVAYKAATFASPGYGVGLQARADVADDRITNIWDTADPVLAASALGQRNVRGDQYFIITGNNPASIISHELSLYESIAISIDKSRQQLQFPDGGQIVNGTADRVAITLSSGARQVGPAATSAGQTWVNSLVPGELSAVSNAELNVANLAAGASYLAGIFGRLAITS